MMHEITSCEVCGKNELYSVLNLGLHPMCDDLVPIGDDRVSKEYPIEILFCDTCCTAHQRFQIPKHELFPQTYHYRSRNTSDVLNGMRELVDACFESHGDISGKKVFDVGCNDGSLLSFFRDKGAHTFGIEPTGAFLDAIKAGHNVINDFLCENSARHIINTYGQFDIITFTNVFAHIEDLSEVIRALKILMHDKTIVIIENHYLGAVIEKFQFDTFYHEHPRTYSFRSFLFIADSLGLQVGKVQFPARYNGNIRITYTPKGSNVLYAKDLQLEELENTFGQKLLKMNEYLSKWREEKKAYIESQVKVHGKLSAKAFPGRAAIPVKLLNLNSEHIKAAYEKSISGKVGHYIPGTRIPILADNEFDLLEEQAPLLNLAWHIREEIQAYMRDLGYKGPIVDIISREDTGA